MTIDAPECRLTAAQSQEIENLRREVDAHRETQRACDAEIARLKADRDAWEKGVRDANRIAQEHAALADRAEPRALAAEREIAAFRFYSDEFCQGSETAEDAAHAMFDAVVKHRHRAEAAESALETMRARVEGLAAKWHSLAAHPDAEWGSAADSLAACASALRAALASPSAPAAHDCAGSDCWCRYPEFRAPAATPEDAPDVVDASKPAAPKEFVVSAARKSGLSSTPPSPSPSTAPRADTRHSGPCVNAGDHMQDFPCSTCAAPAPRQPSDPARHDCATTPIDSDGACSLCGGPGYGKCPKCGGSGRRLCHDDYERRCNECKGSGRAADTNGGTET